MHSAQPPHLRRCAHSTAHGRGSFGHPRLHGSSWALCSAGEDGGEDGGEGLGSAGEDGGEDGGEGGSKGEGGGEGGEGGEGSGETVHSAQPPHLNRCAHNTAHGRGSFGHPRLHGSAGEAGGDDEGGGDGGGGEGCGGEGGGGEGGGEPSKEAAGGEEGGEEGGETGADGGGVGAPVML